MNLKRLLLRRLNNKYTLLSQLYMNKYSQYDDSALIELINQGDTDAFESLYDRYSSKVLRQCYFFCLNVEEAKDLMHDVWVKVFFSINNFQKKSSFPTWLYRITTNHCLNQVKKKTELSINNTERDIPNHNGKETSTELKKILSRLSIEDRTLLMMKYMDEFTYQEIAERLDIGISAVKMRLSRLMKNLREGFNL